ncbi:hypothetical protein [Streptomyces sp. NPDC048603]
MSHQLAGTARSRAARVPEDAAEALAEEPGSGRGIPTGPPAGKHRI